MWTINIKLVTAYRQVVAFLEDERKALEAVAGERANQVCTGKQMIQALEAAVEH